MFDNLQQIQQLADKGIHDEKFRALAKKDPAAALKSIGVDLPAGVEVSVFENGPSTIHAVLPPQGDGAFLDKLDPNVAKVFRKAWADPKFKAKLLKEPAAAIKEATGANVPKSLKIVAHEDSVKQMSFVLPYVPPKSGELSDADLEMVAGGKGDPSAGGCGSALATEGTIVTVSGGVAKAAGANYVGGAAAAVCVGTMFSSFITMAVSASK